jgi:mono/diheme cytochrome c family protein
MNRTVAALLSFILSAPGTALAADAVNGKRLAERWCAGCHIVSTQQNSGTTQAPPFSEVAQRPHIDAPMVAFFLMNPHPKMPDMSLSRTEAADIAAYIVSLK